MKTIKDINDLYRKTFYLEDEAVLPLLAAIVIASKTQGPPIWAYIVGPSSGGKTMLISTLSKIKFVEQVSDLTPNTFLSGMSNSQKETSLLIRLGKTFVIVMKDFTTILSKATESQEAIIAQMREIYDGHIVKFTGTGDKLEWGPKGKATFIMAATEAIYGVQEKFSDMGTRAINYVMKDQPRKKTAKHSIKNEGKLDSAMDQIQDEMAEYVTHCLDHLPKEFPPVPEDFEDEIIDISDFCSIGRSIVKRDYKGAKSLALSAEMPMRMAKQLIKIAQVLIWMNDGKLEEWIRNCVYKVGLDSIPKQRRIVLEVLAKYEKVEVSGVANEINYNTDRSREWIEDLNMFGVCDRIKLSTGKELWKIKDDYRKLMSKYLKITYIGKNLEGDGTESLGGSGNYNVGDIDWETKENNRAMNNLNMDKIFNLENDQGNQKKTQSPDTDPQSGTF